MLVLGMPPLPVGRVEPDLALVDAFLHLFDATCGQVRVLSLALLRGAEVDFDVVAGRAADACSKKSRGVVQRASTGCGAVVLSCSSAGCLS